MVELHDSTQRAFVKHRDVPPLECNLTWALWDGVSTDVLHADFLGFVKVYIGIAYVLTVDAWSDSFSK